MHLSIPAEHAATYAFFMRLLFATFLGAFIGFERQWHHRVAGLQTNALVAAGAFLFVAFSMAGTPSDAQSVARVAAQVVSGIGFLGAGVIMRNGVNVHGINTAATLWCSAAIGVLCGGGQLWEASLGAIFLSLANPTLRAISWRLTRYLHRTAPLAAPYRVAVHCPNADLSSARTALCALFANRGEIVWRLAPKAGADGQGVVEASVDCKVSDISAFNQDLCSLENPAKQWLVEWEIIRS